MKAKTLTRVHLGLAVLWGVLAIPTVIWFKDSVLWVAIMSCYANVYASVSAWQAGRSEEASEEK